MSISGFDDLKLSLPVAQHIGFDPDDSGHLTDAEIELVGEFDLTHGIPEFKAD